ncbi:MAG: ABC transporter permease [Gemmiger sp.]
MLCFFTLSGISTRYTYFERYQDAWDVMARLPDASAEDFARLEPLQTLPGVRSAVVYAQADAACRLDADDQSPALQQLGGLGAVAGDAAAPLEEGWLVNAPILVMDDASFLAYCEEAGLTPSLDGAILLNRVWDSLHSNFRDRLYLPFVRGDLTALTLTGPDGAVLGELPLLGCTDTPPALREEYDQYALVQFWPLSLWQSLDWAPAAEPGVTVRLLGPEGITADGCEALQAAAAEQLDRTGLAYTIENRIAERTANDRMIAGAQAILGAFCLLLAAIGLANVFLNTLGFVGQRRREFARYLALGMTPGELRSLFWIEAAVIAGRPLVITLLLTGGMVAFMLRASYLDPAVFLAEAPVGPVALFAGLIAGAVALAYALGARRVLSGDLTLLLKDDSLR